MARSRTALVGILLALTLVLAAILAAQAVLTANYHRFAVERALRDYSRFAATEFARRADEALTNATLWSVLRPAMGIQPAAPERLPPPSVLGDTSVHGRGFDLRKAGLVRFYFRVTVGRRGAVLTTSGGDISRAMARWITDTVRLTAPVLAGSGRYFQTISGSPDRAPVLLSYYLVRSGNLPVAGYGFVASPADFAAVFQPLLRAPLLPLAHAGDVPNDSLVAVEIRDAAGHRLFHSPAPFHEAYAADSGLGWQQASLVARAAVRPEAARAIVIGGVPASRLPVALVMLALTALLLGTAVFLLRRESELARLRTDFVANVSHELRTPLAQISLFAETLLLGRVRSDAERRRSLAIIHRETGRLTHLVENLLAATRGTGAAPAVTRQAVPMERLAREVVDAFAPVAAARRVRIALEPGEEVEVTADADMLRQILLNLLDNTVKHGPEGQTVRLRITAANGSARIVVDDEGPGIPAGDRERIFERFTRLRPDTSDAGAGIGLAVVRDLVARHGGRVWAEDVPDGRPGARFVVELPR